MALVWKDAYRTGHLTVDGDHEKLFAITNDFCAAKDVAAAKVTLGRLLDYAGSHFAREEAVLAACGPKPETLYFHQQSHAVLAKRLHALILKFGGAADSRIVKETAALLEMWVFNHVVKDDVKIKPILEKHVTVKGKTAAR